LATQAEEAIGRGAKRFERTCHLGVSSNALTFGRAQTEGSLIFLCRNLLPYQRSQSAAVQFTRSTMAGTTTGVRFFFGRFDRVKPLGLGIVPAMSR
jgi:hypothetical protein